ncbi:MAG: hypothetical protein PVI90_01830 [Desulfobacteraceae bacterium]|jgi:hypothetical protein
MDEKDNGKKISIKGNRKYDLFHQKVHVVSNITKAFEKYHAEMRKISFPSKIRGLFKNDYDNVDLQIKEMLNLKIKLSSNILDAVDLEITEDELASIDTFFRIWLHYQFFKIKKNEQDILSMLDNELKGSIDVVSKKLSLFYNIILSVEKNKRIIESLYDFAFAIMEMLLNRDFDSLVNQK